LPEDGALDEAGDGDEELVAEVELPVRVEESAEAKDVGLHGGDDHDLVGAVGGAVGEEEESVAEGGDEGKDGGYSEGKGGFHECSACGFGPDGLDVESLAGFEKRENKQRQKQRQYLVAAPFGLRSGLRQSGVSPSAWLFRGAEAPRLILNGNGNGGKVAKATLEK
jgi:hypothetical protein